MAPALQSLELRVPPPAVVLIVATAMWGISVLAPQVALPAEERIAAAILIAAVAAGFGLTGNLAFRRVKTTVNPLHPERASTLVQSGVYRITRNPMYLALLLFLLAWAVFLSNAWTLPGPLAFLLYITRFQIVPEERALSARFGAAYTAYCTRVRRWL
ncbi:MAG: isoprenylcysteine carboxylmethyltransferase family protein [Ferrovibrio sp.]|uniref:methyltransferase family protein n=1 Tax=Ferrovibrio sp. TaxID=1917215 RepID=UPI002614B592|nr:isoprenylcysteine carboxylmethyltransferase family protein [Ferrovibrio sp.]MCW0232664.1 isoprenylcysteine carboxylmethyltransferase family protein [Ferrovibrio sp.]